MSRPARIVDIAAAAALALLGTVGGAAAQQAELDSTRVHHLRPIVVEARRSPALRDELPQQVDVITREEIERTPGMDVTDVLKRTANVDVIQFPALLSGISVRGFRPQYSGVTPRTLILVDGRPAGATNLASLDLHAVERIEVLRGPASALYGSNAMGGAVNIITRRSEGSITGALAASYGSYGSYGMTLTAGGSMTGALDFDLHVATSGRHEGYSTGASRIFDTGTVTKRHTDGRTSELEEVVRDTLLSHSRFGVRSGGLRLGYDLAPGLRLQGRLDHFRGNDIQNPGDVNVTAYSTRSLNDLERTSGDVALTLDRGAHSLLLRAFGAGESTDYYDSPDDPAYISSRSPVRWRGLQIQDAFGIGLHTVTAGVDLSETTTRSEVFSAADVRTNPYNAGAAIRSLAAFAEGRLDLLGDGRLHATLGGRVDRVDFELDDASLADGSVVQGDVESSSVFNPSGGLVFQPGHGLRLHASAGRSFVTPSAFNVAGYSQRSVGPGEVVATRGNPDLRPERGTSWDLGIGIRRPHQGIDVDLTYFSTRVRDRVAAVPGELGGGMVTPGGDTIRALTTYANADRATIDGLEIALGYDFGALRGYRYSLRLFASGTHLLRARETTESVTTDIRNVAGTSAVFGLEYDDLRRVDGRLAIRYVGERLDSDFVDFFDPGDVVYPEFLVVDLAGGLRLGDRTRLTVEVANLLDEHYYEVRGYPMPGRSLRAGVSLGW